MNKKEAEDIAYLIWKYYDLVDNIGGVDITVPLANMAEDIFQEILQSYPKVKERFDWWSED